MLEDRLEHHLLRRVAHVAEKVERANEAVGKGLLEGSEDVVIVHRATVLANLFGNDLNGALRRVHAVGEHVLTDTSWMQVAHERSGGFVREHPHPRRNESQSRVRVTDMRGKESEETFPRSSRRAQAARAERRERRRRLRDGEGVGRGDGYGLAFGYV